MFVGKNEIHTITPFQHPNEYLGHLFGLAGRVSVVVGAGGHLGSALSRGLASAGSQVALVDMRLQKATKVSDCLRQEGYRGISTHCADATDRGTLEQVRDEVLRKFGHIHVLINGAGINDATPIMEIKLAKWNAVIESQVSATLLACQVFGESMLKASKGSIINITSASAGPPLSQAFAYSVAKAGIKNLTKNLAREWGTSGVRVNALRPGFFPTDWNRANFITPEREASILNHTPMARFGDPQELVGAALWLASDASSFVTGAEIAVDGGFSCMTI
jgi:NAD(P)-dependent dehydrogenase (short-subunit alcohol dehydrogenase family)